MAVAAYALDGGAPDGGLGAFEAEARAVAQLAARVGVFFTFQSAALRQSGTPSPYGIPLATLEVISPLLAAALFGAWFLFNYPDKVEKPDYDPVGSLRAAREESPPWSPSARETSGPRAVALSPLHTFPPPPPQQQQQKTSKKRIKGELLPTSLPPPRPAPQSFHFTL
jgi:hypothetical protein